MSDAEFLAYAGSLALGGLLFLILAVLGLGQGVVLRVLDVLIGLAFLGYAGYLMVVAPESPFVSWFVFITPAAGLVVAVTARRRARRRLKRLEEDLTPQPYARHDATGHAERQPFPSPPPPLEPGQPAPERASRKRSNRMPSGLPTAPPASGLGDQPLTAQPRPARPSGLPQLHAEPGYRGRHEAADDETAEHDYTGGRHRADAGPD
ncbi:hypothetical protein [Actinoplanes sp. URMC 104]|uniref:hypothetical protein n=1 Tax=Actinoplanes sp. URMC 104 TaxID=3423409 RepID=UPI003F1A63D6